MARNPLHRVSDSMSEKDFRAAVSKNIAAEKRAGKPQKQVAAIALSNARRQAPLMTEAIYGPDPTPNPVRLTTAQKKLIADCKRMWNKYYEFPTRANLAAVGRQLEKMSKSKSRRVRLERWRCARNYRPEVQEWIAMELRGEVDPAPDPDWAPLVDEERAAAELRAETEEAELEGKIGRRAARDVAPEIRKFERMMARSNPATSLPAQTKPDVLYRPKYGSSKSQLGLIGRKYYIRSGPTKPWIEVGTTLGEVQREFTSAWEIVKPGKKPKKRRVKNPSYGEFIRTMVASSGRDIDNIVAELDSRLSSGQSQQVAMMEMLARANANVVDTTASGIENRAADRASWPPPSSSDKGGWARRAAGATASGLLGLGGAALGAIGRGGSAAVGSAADLAWEGTVRKLRTQDVETELAWGSRIDPKFVRDVLRGDEHPESRWENAARDRFSKTKIRIKSDAFGGKFDILVRRPTYQAVLNAVAKEAHRLRRKQKGIVGLDKLTLIDVDEDEIPTYQAVFLGTGAGAIPSAPGVPATAPGQATPPLLGPATVTAPASTGVSGGSPSATVTAPPPRSSAAWTPPQRPAAGRGPGQRPWPPGSAPVASEAVFAPPKPRGAPGTADPLYRAAEDLVRSQKKVSQAFLSAKLKISRHRAKGIIEAMEANGVVSAPDDRGRRSVLAMASAPSGVPQPGFVPAAFKRLPNPSDPLQLAVLERLIVDGPAKSGDLATLVSLSGPYRFVVPEGVTSNDVSKALRSMRKAGCVRLTKNKRHWEAKP